MLTFLNSNISPTEYAENMMRKEAVESETQLNKEYEYSWLERITGGITHDPGITHFAITGQSYSQSQLHSPSPKLVFTTGVSVSRLQHLSNDIFIIFKHSYTYFCT